MKTAAICSCLLAVLLSGGALAATANSERDASLKKQQILFCYDPGFNCIDATIIQAEGRWAMFVKDETKVPVAKKNIRMAWADKPAGPWSAAGDPINNMQDWVEGPTAVKFGEDWFLYFDVYGKGHYDGLRSKDLKTWTPITTELMMPKGIRHGTAFAVPSEVLEPLLALDNNARTAVTGIEALAQAVPETTAHLAPAFYRWAETPPMGWNSYNNFGSSVTENEVLANATYMKEKLRAHGWQYVVVDFRWSDATAANYDPNGIGGPLVADKFGRLFPAPNRFPSATDGKGFKPLADKIHAMGLKFGIHIMRGIPRQSVKANAPIESSAFTAADAGNTNSTCVWCKDMFGVKNNSAGQAWYDSIFRLYAAWGVDFVKVDDLSAPYHTEEVEMVRKAIDKCGRPIVFSTSPGYTPLAQATHVSVHANMWRLSGDFWDNWKQLAEAFDLATKWENARGPGYWPDLDMLQLGRLGTRCVGGARMTRFSHDEQRTHLTLWCIARSPLMFGGDLTHNDGFTDSLLTNDEVLAVNQRSTGNRQLYRRGDQIAWIANVPGSKDRYVALFNLSNKPQTDAQVSLSAAGFTGPCRVRDLWSGRDLGAYDNAFSVALPSHGAGLYRVSKKSPSPNDPGRK